MRNGVRKLDIQMAEEKAERTREREGFRCAAQSVDEGSQSSRFTVIQSAVS